METATTAMPAEIKSIPVIQLKPNPWNRTVFDPVALEELVASIQSGGIEEPLIVRKLGEDQYEIASGHRRWLAAQKAGLGEVPCLVRELTDQKVAEMNIEINVQREELPALELGRMLSDYMKRYAMNQRRTAVVFGKTEGWVSQYLGFLTLHPDLKNFTAVKFSTNDLRALKRLNPELQKQVAEELRLGGLKAENIQKRCNQLHFQSKNKATSTAPHDADLGHPQPDPLATLWEPLKLEAMAGGKLWGVTYGPKQIPELNEVSMPAWQFWVVNNGALPKAELQRWFQHMADSLSDAKPGDTPRQPSVDSEKEIIGRNIDEWLMKNPEIMKKVKAQQNAS